MEVKRFRANKHHDYLGRFTKPKFLDAGHNLSTFDINRDADRRQLPQVFTPPPTPVPETIDLGRPGSPIAPDDAGEASRLARLAEAGAGKRILRREARQGIREARRTGRREIRQGIRAGDPASVAAARQQRRDVVGGIQRERQRLIQEALGKRSRNKSRRKKELV